MKRKRAKIPLDQIPEVQEMLSKQLSTIALTPTRAKKRLPQEVSKFGGLPLCFGPKWPACPRCQERLTFVLQILKRDFPSFFFRPGTDVAQLFRCENENCPDNYGPNWDHLVGLGHKRLAEAQPLTSGDIKTVPECALNPKAQLDYPSFWEGKADWWGKTFEAFDKKYRKTGEFDQFCESYTPVEGSKIGGFPSWQQIPDIPACKCGKRREFFFQLASGSKSWGEPHEICIGDAGNVYFFLCADCGTVETRWDCG